MLYWTASSENTEATVYARGWWAKTVTGLTATVILLCLFPRWDNEWIMKIYWRIPKITGQFQQNLIKSTCGFKGENEGAPTSPKWYNNEITLTSAEFWATFYETWHKASFGWRGLKFFKQRLPPFPRVDNIEVVKIHLHVVAPIQVLS